MRGQVDDLLNEIRLRERARRAGAGHDAHQAHVRGPHRLPAAGRACGCATCTPTSTPSSGWRSCAASGWASSTCWSGINLLREGLDLPEVSLVAILDADQEGFLRSDRSLIQTIGRAARHVNGPGDPLRRPDHRLDAARARRDGPPARDPARPTTRSTASRRASIVKSIEEVRLSTHVADARTERPEPEAGGRRSGVDLHDPAKRAAAIAALERQMREAAANLEFELAALLRDQVERAARAGRARRAPRRRSGRGVAAPRVMPRADRGRARGRRARRSAARSPPGAVRHLRGRSRGGQDDLHPGDRARARRRRSPRPARPTRWCTATHGRRGPVFHLDCFRLRSPEEAADLDWEGLLREGDAMLVEWPERAGEWVPPADAPVPSRSPAGSRAPRAGVALMWLALETATDRASVALGGRRRERGRRRHVDGARRHARRAAADDRAALLRRGRAAAATSPGVIVSDGPGSFTGLRVGAAVGEGAGAARERLPLWTAPSLLARAAVASRHAGAAGGERAPTRCGARCYARRRIWLTRTASSLRAAARGAARRRPWCRRSPVPALPVGEVLPERWPGAFDGLGGAHRPGCAGRMRGRCSPSIGPSGRARVASMIPADGSRLWPAGRSTGPVGSRVMDARYRDPPGGSADAPRSSRIERRCFSDPWARPRFARRSRRRGPSGWWPTTAARSIGYLDRPGRGGDGRGPESRGRPRAAAAGHRAQRCWRRGSTTLRQRRAERGVSRGARVEPLGAGALSRRGLPAGGHARRLLPQPERGRAGAAARASAAWRRIGDTGGELIELDGRGPAAIMARVRTTCPTLSEPWRYTVSRSLNKVILIGNLGADPEVRSTQNGGRVATLSIATSRQWKGQAASKQEKTEWHRVIFWNTNYSQARRHRREVLQEGRQGLRRGQHRVPLLAGSRGPDPLHHRDPRQRAHPPRRTERRLGRGAVHGVGAEGGRCTRGRGRFQPPLPGEVDAARERFARDRQSLHPSRADRAGPRTLGRALHLWTSGAGSARRSWR